MIDIKYQSLRTSYLSQIKAENKPNPIGEIFNGLDEYEYRALVLADFNLERYRYLMENYNILELTQMFFLKTAYRELNG